MWSCLETLTLKHKQTKPYTLTPRRKRSRRRPSRTWHNDITRKEGTTWNRKATNRRQEGNKQRTVEDIGGGLRPAVGGQSLSER